MARPEFKLEKCCIFLKNMKKNIASWQRIYATLGHVPKAASSTRLASMQIYPI